MYHAAMLSKGILREIFELMSLNYCGCKQLLARRGGPKGAFAGLHSQHYAYTIQHLQCHSCQLFSLHAPQRAQSCGFEPYLKGNIHVVLSPTPKSTLEASKGTVLSYMPSENTGCKLLGKTVAKHNFTRVMLVL